MSRRRETHEEVPAVGVLHIGGMVIIVGALTVTAAILLVKLALRVA